MKLIIQIPCLDEAESLPVTLAALPRTVAGFDRVEYLVIDDGSSDGTGKIALRHGAHHVVRHSQNRGLAAAFMTGITSCLALGADVIVNIDGDNQYDGSDIPALVAPLREGIADHAMGIRPLHDRDFFPLWKSLLTRFGTVVARLLSGAPTHDAPSGLRAYSARVARQLRVHGHYSYTMETLVLTGSLRLRLASVPIRVHMVTRPSRLMRSVPEYIRQSAFALLRGVALHRPRLAWGLVVFAGLLPITVDSGLHAIRTGTMGWSPWPMVVGFGLFVAGSVAIARWRHQAAHVPHIADMRPEPMSAAFVWTNAHCGNHLATADRDQVEPLSDPDPVACIDVAFAATAGEQTSDG
jgi:hypothetical protein